MYIYICFSIAGQRNPRHRGPAQGCSAIGPRVLGPTHTAWPMPCRKSPLLR